MTALPSPPATNPDKATAGPVPLHFTIMEKMNNTAHAAYSRAAGKWPRAEDPLVPAYAAVRKRLARLREMKGLPETARGERRDHEIAMKAAAEAAECWGSRTT